MLPNVSSLAITLLAIVLPTVSRGVPADPIGLARDDEEIESKSAEDSPSPRKLPYTISRETTRITEPLGADGSVDYLEAMNARLSEGVTPENNAFVPLYLALGPEGPEFEDPEFEDPEFEDPEFEDPEFDETRARARELEFCRRLGIEPLRREAERLRSFGEWLAAEGHDEDVVFDLEERADEIVDRPWTRAQFPELSAWIEANAASIARLREGARRKRYYLPLVSDAEHFRLMSVHLNPLLRVRGAVRLIAARALRHLGEGRPRDACDDLVTAHRLSRHIASGGTLIEGLIGIALDATVGGCEPALLASAELSDEDLRAYVIARGEIPLPRLDRTIDLGERFFSLDAIASVAVRPDLIDSIDGPIVSSGGFLDRTFAAAKRILFRQAIDWDLALRQTNQDHDEIVRVLEIDSVLERQRAAVELSRRFEERTASISQPASIARAVLVRSERSKSLAGILAGLTLPTLVKASEQMSSHRVRDDLFRVAVELEIHRRRTGAYPGSLAALADATSVDDPFAESAQLRYRRTSFGHALWSVGPDGEDTLGAHTDERAFAQAIHAGDADDIVFSTPIPRELLEDPEPAEDEGDADTEGDSDE